MTQTSVLETRFLSECLRGNPDAIAFVRSLFDAFHFWDDLIDRDNVLEDSDIDRNCYAMLVELPMNPFWNAHRQVLMPLVITAIHNWKLANRTERNVEESSRDDKIVAFVIRSSYVDILVMCCHLIGGFSWAQAWAEKIRAVVHNEGFDGYLENLSKEKELRDGML